MRPEMLMGALGLNRSTSDTARVAGALAGAGGVALIGMGPAYVLVTLMYVVAAGLSAGIAGRPATHAAPRHPMAELKDGFRYAWNKPDLIATFAMAFLVNLLAYPSSSACCPTPRCRSTRSARPASAISRPPSGWGALVGSLVVGAGRLPFGAARAHALERGRLVRRARCSSA
jgi:hypothetical protein